MHTASNLSGTKLVQVPDRRSLWRRQFLTALARRRRAKTTLPASEAKPNLQLFSAV